MDCYWSRLTYKRHEVSACDREPIEFCGAIQDCGWLVVTDLHQREILAASENCEALFSKSMGSILNSRLMDLLDISFDPETQSQIDHFILPNLNRAFQLTGYRCDQFLFFELEETPINKEARENNSSKLVNSLIDLVHHIDSEIEIDPMLNEAVKLVQSITNFDRVMVYGFEPNGDGRVVVETVRSGLESFQGLYYPASDIPPQVRQLYASCKYRMIVDVNSLPVRVQTRKGLSRSKLNLGPSALRAVSPFHIQYLKNLGIRSSFSLPLKVNGTMWGLLACHHYSERRHLNPKLRSTMELAAQIVSGRLNDQISERKWRKRDQIHSLCQSLLEAVTSGGLAVQAFKAHGQSLLELTESSGAYVRIAGDDCLIGETPSRGYIKKLIQKLNSVDSTGLWQSQKAAVDLDLPVEPQAVGLLAIPLSLGFEDLIIWFRPEFKCEVRWGGNPHEKTLGSEPLGPRASFQVWVEQVNGQSRPWTDTAQEGAKQLLITFVRGIFQKAVDLSKANKELARMTRAKDEFIGTVSHELRTPLGVMIGWIEILRDLGNKEETFNQALEIIDRNAKLQVNLINDLLDVSRIISGKIHLDPQDGVDIGAIVTEAVRDIQPTAQAKSISLKMNLQKEVISTADPERIMQVISNLLINAIKFTGKGGTVWVSLDDRDDCYRIRIQDNGIGIEQHQLRYIFERFAQGRQGHQATNGLGLGLSIAKALVELHGGQIEAQSEGKNCGSTFVMILPKFKINRAEESIPFEHNLSSPAHDLEGIRVLIAEDNCDAASSFRHILERAGAQVAIANDGEEAFHTLQDHDFDLLLSDIGMPGWDGLSLIKHWREHEQSHRMKPISAIALTAYATSKDRTKCLRAGFQGHLAKPIEKDELIAVVRSFGSKG